MIGTSLGELILIRVSIFVLQYFGLICAGLLSGVLLTFGAFIYPALPDSSNLFDLFDPSSWTSPWSWRWTSPSSDGANAALLSLVLGATALPLLGIVVAEAVYLALILPPHVRRLRDAGPASHPTPSLSAAERRRLFDRCCDTIPDWERYLRGWFLGADKAEIRRDNVREFLLWAFFERGPVVVGTGDGAETEKPGPTLSSSFLTSSSSAALSFDPVFAELTPAEEVELEGYLSEAERLLGRRLPPGRGSARALRLTLDPVAMAYRSVAWYGIIALIDLVTHMMLRWGGFDYKHVDLTERASRWGGVFPPRVQLYKWKWGWRGRRKPVHSEEHGAVVGGDATGTSDDDATAQPRLSDPAPSAEPIMNYWHHRHTAPDKLPVVFLHGIGVGLIPYATFLADVSRAHGADDVDDSTTGGEVGVIVPEILPISSRLTADAPLGKQEFLRQLAAMVDDAGWLPPKRRHARTQTHGADAEHAGEGPDGRAVAHAHQHRHHHGTTRTKTSEPPNGRRGGKGKGFVLVAHSYGTVLATHVLRDALLGPAVRGLVLADPVSLLLHLPDVAYNFTRREPRLANEWQLWFFASMDPGVAYTLGRHFFWRDNEVWREELVVPVGGDGDEEASAAAAASEEEPAAVEPYPNTRSHTVGYASGTGFSASAVRTSSRPRTPFLHPSSATATTMTSAPPPVAAATKAKSPAAAARQLRRVAVCLAERDLIVDTASVARYLCHGRDLAWSEDRRKSLRPSPWFSSAAGRTTSVSTKYGTIAGSLMPDGHAAKMVTEGSSGPRKILTDDGIELLWYPGLDHAQAFDMPVEREAMLAVIRRFCMA